MIQNLKTLGIKVPNGFAITTDAYHDFIKYNKLDEKITNLVSDIDDSDLNLLRKTGLEVRQLSSSFFILLLFQL